MAGAATLVIVGLGSNLAHPRRQLARAVFAIARLPGTRLVRVSRNYVSAPVGSTTPQPDFVNAAVAARTTLAPRALLRFLQAIERRQMRRHDPETTRNSARTLDLDLLLYGRRRIHIAQLEIPHPRMHERAFTLRPLRNIAPAITIPGRGLARWFLFAVKHQRIAPTRSHPQR